MARRLARSLSIARVSHGSWRGVAALLQPGPARPISRSRLKKRSQSLRALRYCCCPGFLRVQLDHGERLGQEEHGHDDALFVLTELASCRRLQASLRVAKHARMHDSHADHTACTA